MGRRGDELVEVELVENEGAPSPRDEQAVQLVARVRSRWAARGPRTRRRISQGVGLVAALACVGAVVAQGSGAAREAAIARLPGIVPSLDSPPSEVWRLTGASPLGWVGDDLLVRRTATDRVERIDARTGAVRWSVTATGTCATPDQWYASSFIGMVAAEQVDSAYLVCARVVGATAEPNPIEVLDLADGRARHGPVVDGVFLGLGGVDDDLIIAAAAPDGRVRAERWSIASRTVRWTYQSPDVVADPESGGTLAGSAPGAFSIVGRRTVLLDPETGQEVTGFTALQAAATEPDDVVLPDGSTLHGATDATGRHRRTAASGESLPSMLGWPMPVGVDDGSAPDILLVTSPYGQSSAIELSSGAVLWPVPGGSHVVARLDSRGVLLESGQLQVVDLRTGAPLWSDEGTGQTVLGPLGGAVTDGHLLGYLVQARGDAVLTVADLGTGVERSHLVLGVGDAALIGSAHDGTVVVFTARSIGSADQGAALVGLRP